MTIHHDKLGYGKLASSREDISEVRIAEMLKRLNAESTDEKEEEKPSEDTKKEEKK